MTHHPSGSDVLVVGAGVIGLAIAWRCRQRGLTVTVVDPAPGSGASTTAAGMLAPVTELNYGELDLLRLGIESARRYPDFAAELAAATGIDIGYRRTGTVVAAWDGADLATLRDLHALQTSLGLTAELITGRELRELEPALAPGLPGGLLAADDHQVDNRRLHDALLQVNRDRVVAAAGARADPIRRPGHRRPSRRRPACCPPALVVLAAGAWSGSLADGRGPPGQGADAAAARCPASRC